MKDTFTLPLKLFQRARVQRFFVKKRDDIERATFLHCLDQIDILAIDFSIHGVFRDGRIDTFRDVLQRGPFSDELQRAIRKSKGERF
uniref:Uncharacterized protein n=1 Tax=Klebsiella pneumoniae TaxID=573 RepID=A0A455X6U2_KLEPN|nr:hypothetical protein [Klebsiella pneumoniae]